MQTESQPSTKRSIKREVWSVFALSVFLTAGIVALGGVVGWIGENALGLVALVFLYLPIEVLRRRRKDAIDYGLTLKGAPKHIAVGLLIALLTFVPFLVGFHIWEVVAFAHEPEVSASNYLAWPERLRQEPVSPDSGFFFWRRQRSLIAEWHGAGDWNLQVTSDADLYYRSGVRPTVVPDEGGLASWQIQTGGGDHQVVFWARDGNSLTIHVTRDDQVPSIVAPGAEIDGGSVTIERSWTWIPLALLVQLLLIALPEEFFYRGYLQGRLNEVFTRKYRLGPFHTSAPIIITSLMFALGHFFIGFDPRRLSVFLPSLAFGWLRDRTGGIGASIVYHAACNLMVELVVVHYWPT